MSVVNGEPGFTQLTKLNILDTLLVKGVPIGGGGLSTYGTLTNSAILALATPSENETADSSDDFIRMVYIAGAWRTTLGGLLV